MRLTDYWRMVWGHRIAILAVGLFAALLAGVASSLATPLYRATTSVYFSLPSGDSATDLSQGSTYTQAQMLSFAELATQPVVLDAVIDELGLEETTRELADQISTRASRDTVILSISVARESPEQAALIANTVADEMRTVVRDLAPKDAAGDPSINAETVGEATPPKYPFRPNKRLNVAVALVGGLLLGTALTIARELFDTRVRSDAEAGELTDAPVLTAVPYSRELKRLPVVMEAFPHGPAAEAYRRLRINLKYLRSTHEVDVVTLTSSLSGEGKSVSSLNFAYACAESGDRVLLIDGDMRGPGVTTYAGLEPSVGLTTVLTDDADFDDVVQSWSQGARFDVLASGPLPPNPTQLIESAAMRTLLDTLRQRYDLVIIDSPPLLPVSDAALFAARSSGAILVVNLRKAHRNDVTQAAASLATVGADLLGVVVNGAEPHSNADYYGAYVKAPSRWAMMQTARRRRSARRRRDARRAARVQRAVLPGVTTAGHLACQELLARSPLPAIARRVRAWRAEAVRPTARHALRTRSVRFDL